MVGMSYYKRPASITLSRQSGSALSGCYLAETISCSDKLSREHLVSRNVLDRISTENVTIIGFPWQEPGAEQRIGKSSLVGKCLCAYHNSCLSYLDASAGRFMEFLGACDQTRSGHRKRFLVSGSDIERWLLKTTYAMAHSNILGAAGSKLEPKFHTKIDLVRLLEDPMSWPDGSGLYLAQSFGDRISPIDQFGLAAITKSDDHTIVGAIADVLGLRFILMAVPPDDPRAFRARRAYRPSAINFVHPDLTNQIQISWPGNNIGEETNLLFVGK